MFRLELLTGAEAGRTVPCEGPSLSIGRASDNDLALKDAHVSSHHAVIRLTADGYLFEDLRSTNGSSIARGDERMPLDESREFRVLLVTGDRILLGPPSSPVTIAFQTVESDTAGQVVAVARLRDLGEFRGRLERQPDQVARLYKVLQELSWDLDLDAVLRATARAVFSLLDRATHLVVVLSQDDAATGKFVPVHRQVRDNPEADEDIPVSHTVFRRVLAERAALLVANALDAEWKTQSMLGARILSTMAVPLWRGEEHILGVLQVDNRASAGMFGQQDLELLIIVASQASLAIQNARLYKRLDEAEKQLAKENRYLKGREERRQLRGIIGKSAPMNEVSRQIEKVVDTRVTVLIEGETGTGKELVASAVHYQSRRRDKLFVAQNCAALPENLLESELFGHKRGAFTGADHDKKGLFEIADGGTLFLDEVSEMPVALQGKLLRALQDGEFRPLGGTQARRVDVRVVAATNRKLEECVKNGSFREDLYYRLRVFPIRVPPLRERKDDIPLLVDFFLRKYGREFGKEVRGISAAAMESLRHHDWPGNVRELENEVQRLVIQIEPGDEIRPEHISSRVRRVDALVGEIAPQGSSLHEMMDDVERWILRRTLEETGGNRTAAAKKLGISREGLHKKLAKLGIHD
ncbi:MAG: sigma 54-interacting transcriptional regulator [Deltaproteobacteria bacterium]|nr:sigma 54-interacting transcriptional regulator [Deltaproteobacteria bacterium]